MNTQKDLINLLMQHSSTRKYTDQPIDEKTKQTILACSQMAPTSSYLQAYTIIEVTDPAKRDELATISGGQEWLKKAPLTLLFCADLHRSEKFLTVTDPKVFQNTELYTVAVVDATLAAQKALIAAQSLGLGGVIVGGVRNEMDQLADLFNLPERVMPLFVLCLGYPAEQLPVKPRLPQQFIVGTDAYPDKETDLTSYNQEVSNYYDQLTNGADTFNWVERCTYALEQKPRYEVDEFVKKAGFLKN
ncbi:nitroreductase family protein [Candidatus Enterococcus courvalinii]|uniref:Nitroreductase family protein n=1 Tax=Candidatus Enterococcus courvalinii TaxID=2815329 RepID=A0ABS3HX41_9ENTE|nr:nitroreductase family protein [Enterococcus sp. MSG2901]MBO0481043.1 nitroreductase family protein [Enterococcus sp. MSG2901]